MPLKVSTMQPGLLIGLRTSIRGNVSYVKNVLRSEKTDDGAQVETWETTKTVLDAEEFERASKIRQQARNMIAGVCVQSACGLLCPEYKVERLEEAIAAARALTDDFNRTARVSEIRLDVIAGRIASDDATAFRAISNEIKDLISDMEQGIANLDPKAIRAAATRARAMGQMLTPQARNRVQEAIKIARATANKIAKAGVTPALEVDKEAIAALASRRTAFLDMDELGQISGPAHEGRAVDFDPADAAPIAVEQPKERVLELDI